MRRAEPGRYPGLESVTALSVILKVFGRDGTTSTWFAAVPATASATPSRRARLGSSRTDFVAGLTETIARYRDNEAW